MLSKITPFLICALILGVATPDSADATVWINEFMASNGSTISDEDGDFEDWIELHNFGDAVVDLQGWSLSDDPGDPKRWTFPDSRPLAPGEYLLVWASGKDRPGSTTEPISPQVPNEIDGLTLWLRADNAQILPGNRVRDWPDLSGLDNHASQSIPEQRPLYVGGALNGHPILRFNRSASQQLLLDPATFKGLDDFTGFTIMTVAHWSGGFRSGLFGGFRGNNPANAGSSIFEVSDASGGLRLRLPPGVDFTAPSAVDLNQWHILGATRDAASGQAQVRRDGETLAQASGTVGRTVLSDYERIPVASSHDDSRTFGGDIAEMMVFNRSLSSNEISGLERYLSVRYGLVNDSTILRPHTNFRIAAEGETLLLTRPDGSIADEVPPVTLPRDVSYGRISGESDRWALFYEPTPEAPNSTPALTEPIEAVTFSHPAGVYASPVTLTINHSDPDVTVIYTLDGSEPDIENLDGTEWSYMNRYTSGPLIGQQFIAQTYNGPVQIHNRSPQPDRLARISTTKDSNPQYFPTNPVKKATVVRARPYINGAPGPVTTATYFVSPDGDFDYDLPIVSLSADEDGFFDFFDGIYVAGVDNTTQSGARICDWANYNRRGREAERAVHVEFFASGTRVLEQSGGARVQGNCSRGNPFKSLRLYARSMDAGDEGLFDFPFFTDTVPGALFPENTNLRRLILRTPNINDTVFSRLFQGVYEGVTGRVQPVIQFLNGEYWGLVFARDRFDPHHLEQYYGINPDNVTIIGINYRHEFEPIPISYSNRVYTISSGIPADLADFEAMRAFIINNNMANAANYAAARKLICIDSFIDHLILKIFAGDDHYAPEVIHWRVRVPENDGIGDGRWRFVVKDFDSTLNTDNYVRGLANGTHPRPFGHETFTSLLDNPEFRQRFVNRFADLLNTHFLTERFQEIIHRSYNEVAPYWTELTNRWRNADLSNPDRPFTATDRQNLINWSIQHPARQRSHIRSHFSILPERPLTVDVNLPESGRIRINSIVLSGDTPGVSDQPYPWTGLYFPGYPLELEAIPQPGYRFVEWHVTPAGSGTSVNADPVVSINPFQPITAEAIFEEIPASEFPLALHRWEFEDPFGFPSASFTLGGGQLRFEGPPAVELARNTPAQDFSTAHLRINEPLDATLILAMPTTGFESISLEFLTRRSGQGAGIQVLSYTTDGQTWNELESYEVFDAPPQARHFDFSMIPKTADNPDFAVRIQFEQGAGGSSGNHRFDDIILSGVSPSGSKRPPTVLEDAPAMIELAANRTEVLDIDHWFADIDGNPLTYSVQSSKNALLSSSINAGRLILTGLAAGEATITVSASDGTNPSMPHPVRVLVHGAPFPLAFGDFRFNAWPGDAPAGVYPPHMLFVQSGTDDPGIAQSLDHAYRIPAWDASDPKDVDFPYNATSRTRINGLDQDGISFVNTGRGRDLGGATLTLDATGADNIRVHWTAGTVEPNSRIYGIRLQYRRGVSEDWTDVLLDGEPSLYVRDEESGHSMTFGPVPLPSDLDDTPLVQLRWLYHHIGGTTGPRAKLRLDDLRVEASSRWANLPEFLPDGNGLWHQADNWSGGIIPDGVGVGAFVPATVPGGREISLTGTVTLGTLWVETTGTGHRIRIHGESLEDRFVFDGGTQDAVVYIDGTAGGHVELDPRGGVGLASDLLLFVQQEEIGAGLEALRLSGSLAGPGALIKEGPGKVHLAGGGDVENPISQIRIVHGEVRVDGDYPVPVELYGAGQLSGNGAVGRIGGQGKVRLGAAMLIAEGLDGPMVTAQFNQVGATGNGLLYLHGADPLPSPVDLILLANTEGLLPGDCLRGGIFIPSDSEKSVHRGALDVRLMIADPDGAYWSGTAAYRPATPDDKLSWRMVRDAVSIDEVTHTGLIIEVVRGGDPHTYDQWIGQQVRDAIQRGDPAITGPHADPFGSGVSNLLRYALGIGWDEAINGHLPRIQRTGAGFQLQFPYNPELTDIRYHILQSPDLEDWSVLFDSIDQIVPESTEGWISLPLETDGSGFYWPIVLPQAQ